MVGDQVGGADHRLRLGAVAAEQLGHVDGEPFPGARWVPVAGTHTFRVVWASGRSLEATVVVN